MPKLIDVPEVGQVEFPDTMSDTQVEQAIVQDILPSRQADVSTTRGLMASVQRGGYRIQGLPDVMLLAGMKNANKPTVRQERRAYVTAMNDPRYMEALITGESPLRAESLFGPTVKLDQAMNPARMMQQFTADDVAANEQAIAALPRSEAQRELATTTDKWAAWRKNPIELTASIALESLPPSIAGAIVGTAIGGPGTGTAMGAGAGSGLLTFSGELLGEAGRHGYDVAQPARLQAFLNDSKAFDAAVNVATTKAGIVGPLDALTAGTAGRFIGPALQQGLKRALFASGKEALVQAGGGAGGEFLAQMMSGQPIDTFDIAMEGIAELGSAPVEVASNLRGVKRANSQAETHKLKTETEPETFSEFGGEVRNENRGSKIEDGKDTAAPSSTLNPPPSLDLKPAAQPIADTVPEAPNTILAQYDWLRRGKRPAVMIAADGFVPAWVSEGDRFAMHETSAGKFAYDTSVLTKDQIDQAIAGNRLGTILGYGIEAKPAPGTEVGTVVVRDKQGTEKQAVVTDAANLPAVLKRAQEVADDGDVVKLETPEQVIAARQRETAPPVETEKQRMARENVEAMAAMAAARTAAEAGSQKPETGVAPLELPTDKLVKMEGIDRKTGDIVEREMPAAKAGKWLEGRMDIIRKLLDCLGKA